MTDIIEQLPNGDYAVTKPGTDGKPFRYVYAIHPDRLPAPRLTHQQAKKEISAAEDVWRRAEQQAESIRTMIVRYFHGNEKYRGKMLELRSGGNYEKLEIPLDVLLGVGWVDRLLEYGKECDGAAERAKWDYVKAVNEMMPDFHPDKKPIPPMPDGVDPAIYGAM